MCHLDIAPRNLLLDGQGRVWILDWAYAGGYPPYFDQAVLMKSGDRDFTQGLLDLMGNEYGGGGAYFGYRLCVDDGGVDKTNW